jgi:2-C-methyl-D-erythritol 4-phosphate cytidylyltransferase
MNALVVVAGGSGQRMGSALPKQYLDLQGKPVIIRTLEKFFLYDPDIKIVVVLAQNHLKFWEKIGSCSVEAMGPPVAPGGGEQVRFCKEWLEKDSRWMYRWNS